MTPQDPVAVADEIGVPFHRRTDRRFEHRRKETRDEGEDRRIRPAGLFTQQKSLVRDKGGKGIDVGNCQFVPLGWRVAPKSLQFQCLVNFSANQALHDRPERHRHGFEELGRPLGKIGVVDPARRHQGPIKMLLAHSLGRPRPPPSAPA